jgi:NAD(P)-dependent dehydrogenase (short-subunit alcohol dehydrogenase family)
VSADLKGQVVVITAAAQGIGRATEAARTAFIARQPIGRIGTPQEIADLAVYLAGATYTTGQVHIIDGGWAI